MDTLLVLLVIDLFGVVFVHSFPNGEVKVEGEISLPRNYANPEVTEGYYEGDIDYKGLRNAVKSYGLVWPSGIVHYKIDSTYNNTIRHTFEEAMREIEHDTAHNGKYCVRFEQRTDQRDYIHIRPEKGCHSPIGRHYGEQTVSLGFGCEHKGTVMHELLHTLGFWHEQNRYDRDDYVTVHYDNILEVHWHDFTIHTTRDMSTFGQPYDYQSIMHYGPYVFAKDKSSPSITPNKGVEIGQRDQLSEQDVKMIQLLYGCPVDTSHITSADTARNYLVKCDFEQGFCNLHQAADAHSRFMRREGPAPTTGTGPNGDHTNGIGYYLYAHAMGHHSHTAEIITPHIPGGEYYCVRMSYFIWGKGGGYLDVYIVGHRVHRQTVKRYYGTRDNWVDTYIDLNASHTTLPFQIVFQAHVTTSEESSVAIDDLQIYKGECVI